MSLSTLLGYLIGLRSAIEQIAADPWAGCVGLALLLSAGLARTYRSRDLLAQPWHLLLPLAAALTLSSVLYLFLYAVLAEKWAGPPPFWAGYRSLLGLFLLTAPLAWLYALPFERFLAPARAIGARLGVLALVAAWRVALMTRAVGVLLDGGTTAAFFLVMLVADAALLVGLIVTSLPRREAASTPQLLSHMGGVPPPRPRSRDQHLLTSVTCAVAALAVLTLPLWGVGVYQMRPSADSWRRLAAAPGPWSAPDAGVWSLVGGAALFFLCLLPWSQRPQRLRGRVERLLKQGQVAAALELMSAHARADFPPSWSPPPTRDFREPPTLLGVLEAVTAGNPAPWVRAAYLERFKEYLAEPVWYWYYDADLERLAALLARLPEGPVLARQAREAVTAWDGKLADDLLWVHRDKQEPGDEEKAEGRLPLLLLPEPEPTGRRAETVAALWRLAEAN
jgi:hypothetical protein